MGIEPTVPLPGQQFSRLPDSATLAPLRLVELASRQDRVGTNVSSLRSAVGELTLGSVIFQLVFFIFFCKPESRQYEFIMEDYLRRKAKHSFEFSLGVLLCP